MTDLETSILPVDPTETSHVPTNKRRSSIFQRQSINGYHDYDESEYTEAKSDQFDRNNYISSLRKEEAEWKKTLKERKLRRRQLAKELKSRDDVDLDLTILDESELIFLSERPNYESIGDSIEKLRNFAGNVVAVNLQVNCLYKTLIEKLKEDIYKARNQLYHLSNI